MKTCRKCLTPKPFSGFYKHTNMADGHLSECKECTKERTRRNSIEALKDPVAHEAYIIRVRGCQRKRRALGLEKPTPPHKQKIAMEKWEAANPTKRDAVRLVNKDIKLGRITRMPCLVCGKPKAQAHHEDYSKPLDITWLCRKHHHERHNELRRLERLATRI